MDARSGAADVHASPTRASSVVASYWWPQGKQRRRCLVMGASLTRRRVRCDVFLAARKRDLSVTRPELQRFERVGGRVQELDTAGLGTLSERTAKPACWSMALRDGACGALDERSSALIEINERRAVPDPGDRRSSG